VDAINSSVDTTVVRFHVSNCFYSVAPSQSIGHDALTVVHRINSILLSNLAGPVTNKSSDYGLDNYKHFRSSTQPTHTKVVKQHVKTGELN
jgi:hypothetical protein